MALPAAADSEDAGLAAEVADGDGAELEQAAADIRRVPRARIGNSLKFIGEVSFGGMIITDPPPDRRAQLYVNSNHSVNRLSLQSEPPVD